MQIKLSLEATSFTQPQQ